VIEIMSSSARTRIADSSGAATLAEPQILKSRGDGLADDELPGDDLEDDFDNGHRCAVRYR
jgi:hypothetical protein